MLFNSYAFLLVFLPAAIIVFRIADGYPRLRTWTLILLSLVFYGYWNPWFLLLLIGSIAVNWLAANAFAATRNGAIITAAVVASLAGGVTEILDDGVNGLGHAPGDIQGLARSIDRLLCEPELRKRYGFAARLTAQAKLDPKRMAQQFIDVYQNC